MIDEKRQLLKTAQPRRPQLRRANNVNNLLDDRVGIALPSHFRRFLHDKLFNGRGHDLRHGRTDEAADEYARWAFVAVLGWLDRVESTDFMHQFGDILDVALEPAVAA